ncbi:MAG: preprotein translocase subunit YajC [Lachnospiraceae bacterium]|nr:preprotein translocase subunit YajC [Lachnospiraceae bacterium]
MFNILASAQDTFFLVYIVVILFAFYFILIRPQSKEKKKVQALLDSMEIGDSVLTTAGFYGVIIDITDEIVIVEFGNNKNCRIPMKKTSVIGVEKPGSSKASSSSSEKQSALGKEKK